MSLKKLCKHIGCSRYRVEGHNYCDKHIQDEDNEKNVYSIMKHNEWSNLYQCKEWKEISNAMLVEHPICQYCLNAQATEVHHKIPHRGNKELFLDKNNLVALCHNCHTKETIKEMYERRYGTKEDREMKKRYGI